MGNYLLFDSMNQGMIPLLEYFFPVLKLETCLKFYSLDPQLIRFGQ